MRRLNPCFKILLTLMFINFSLGCDVSDSTDITFIHINLTDTLDYVQYAVDSVSDKKYHPSSLFDADFESCWVIGSTENTSHPSLYFRIQDIHNTSINIFSGYGKSQKLYWMNARPKEVKFSLYAAINPDGYISESNIGYKCVKFPDEKVILLADSCTIQSISLKFSVEKLNRFTKTVSHYYDSTIQIPKADTCFIVGMEILSAYAGTHYNDICISELFFNDRFVAGIPENDIQINNIYINSEENALLIDDSNTIGKIVYRDTSSVLQLIGTSEDKKWAILISMPAEIEGRVETIYHLINLISGQDITQQIEKVTGNYPIGNEMYFQSGGNSSIFLMYMGNDFEYHQIELK
ncbi:MAG: hypothetical protein JW956_15280 [Calditrichaceae bacterium]|nr:hypothetical protein [Calditrichaceae bacterium]